MTKRVVGPAIAVALVLSTPPARAEVKECLVIQVAGNSIEGCGMDICVTDPPGPDVCVPIGQCPADGLPCLPVVNEKVPSQLDPALCAVLATLAPGLGPVIDGTGDIYVGDSNPENKIWDCPPYDVS